MMVSEVHNPGKCLDLNREVGEMKVTLANVNENVAEMKKMMKDDRQQIAELKDWKTKVVYSVFGAGIAGGGFWHVLLKLLMGVGS